MKLTLDKDIYDKQALLKTAYSFSNRVYLHLSQDQTHWFVEWTPKNGAEVMSSAFENELIDQQLRLELVRSSQDIRKLLLARAFASTVMEIPASAPQPEMVDMEESDIMKGWYASHDHE